jgi:fructose-1,6-bisphosphatase I
MTTPDAQPITLTRFILNSQHKHPDASGDLTLLMVSIQLACKVISSAVRRAGIMGLYGLQGSVNVQGEEVKKLDTLSHDTFVTALSTSGRASVLVSEEAEEAIICGNGKYCVVFDPLDGSSNIDVNGSIGSIFAIYKRENHDAAAVVSDVLQPGNRLACAGYCMYGSSTQMVLTWGQGTHIFTLDPSVGEFTLTAESIKIPEKPQTIYSVNEGNAQYWYPAMTKFVNHVKFELAKPYSARYVGSMVADVHRTLIYGGIFCYPADKKSPNGKLRLLYEVNPMSFLIEQAGGTAISVSGDGAVTRALDIVPKSIHERQPVYLGCNRDVQLFRGFLG